MCAQVAVEFEATGGITIRRVVFSGIRDDQYEVPLVVVSVAVGCILSCRTVQRSVSQAFWIHANDK